MQVVAKTLHNNCGIFIKGIHSLKFAFKIALSPIAITSVMCFIHQWHKPYI